METSIFATKATSAEAINDLVANVDQYTTESGEIRTAEVPTGEGYPKYSRAWLILRRAWLEQHNPKALWQPTQKAVAAAESKFGDNPDWLERHVYGPKVVELHTEGCSWGEIMVRLGKTEAFVRKAFEKADAEAHGGGGVRSVGLRTGKGGRFVADRPDLYQGGLKAEGAEIPADEAPSAVPVPKLRNADKVKPADTEAA